MKNLLLLLLLLSGSVLSQTTYTIEKDAYLYDLPDGDFLTVVLKNNKSHFKHYDVTGTILWADSLSFYLNDNNVEFQSIERFGLTDDYLVIMKYDNTPNYIDYAANDTLAYQFTGLNLATHEFTYNRIDIFHTRYIRTLNISDTSIYLFIGDYTYNPTPYIGVNTYQINSQFEISQISTSDSLHYLDGHTTKFYLKGDSVSIYQYVSDVVYLSHYNLNMSLLSQHMYNVNLGSYFEYIHLSEKIGNDSILILAEGDSPASFVRNWRLEWVDLSLSTISSYQMLSPIANAPSRYRISYGVQVDRINKLIYILGVDNQLSSLNPLNPQKLFVFDYNLNLICEMPVIIGTEGTNTLCLLNDKVYLKVKGLNNINLYQIGCQALGVDHENQKESLIVFPNPSSGIVTIDFSELLIGQREIYVIDLNGRQVSSFNSEGLSNAEVINLESLDKGIYFLEIHLNGQFVESHKVILK
jgi:hypothetical protein